MVKKTFHYSKLYFFTFPSQFYTILNTIFSQKNKLKNHTFLDICHKNGTPSSYIEKILNFDSTKYQQNEYNS